VRGADGRVVPAATRIAPGAELTLQLRDGRVRARAEHVDIEPRTP
jgi:exonuclease VII large subunit